MPWTSKTVAGEMLVILSSDIEGRSATRVRANWNFPVATSEETVTRTQYHCSRKTDFSVRSRRFILR